MHEEQLKNKGFMRKFIRQIWLGIERQKLCQKCLNFFNQIFFGEKLSSGNCLCQMRSSQFPGATRRRRNQQNICSDFLKIPGKLGIKSEQNGPTVTFTEHIQDYTERGKRKKKIDGHPVFFSFFHLSAFTGCFPYQQDKTKTCISSFLFENKSRKLKLLKTLSRLKSPTKTTLFVLQIVKLGFLQSQNRCDYSTSSAAEYFYPDQQPSRLGSEADTYLSRAGGFYQVAQQAELDGNGWRCNFLLPPPFCIHPQHIPDQTFSILRKHSFGI